MTRRREVWNNPEYGVTEIRMSAKGQYYTPDTVWIQKVIPVEVDDDGYMSPQIATNDQYVDLSGPLPAYSYLATGRFFSTKITPKEYGDGDVDDMLIVIIHKKDVTAEMIEHIRPTAVIRLTRAEYGLDRALYRLDTGNPYETHWEYKAVPLVD